MGVEEREFLKYKLSELKKSAKKFQVDCDNALESEENILLCLPTGSGKTNRFLIWALEKILELNQDKKVIITAPIKALSNQRFRELYLEGYNVGIETGDIKFNTEDCTFLCCTQEIATYKYTGEEYIIIIDEFHYIYSDSSRARAYIECLVNSKCLYTFICSATLGDVEKIRKYIERITCKKFFLYNGTERLTDLHYMDRIDLCDIRNAFVVSFSSNDCVKNANILRMERNKDNLQCLGQKYREELVLKTATKYDITNNDLILNALFGIAYYFGKMLPKEKLFVSDLFSQKVIDTVFGTDALSLGVNFPIKNVVLTSARKSNKIISKNLFEQISGRAGRYGLYDEGFVYYCDSFNGDSNLKEDFETCKNALNENVTITILPSIKNIISGISTIDDEIKYVREYSTELIDEEQLRKKIMDSLEIIRNYDIVESFAQLHFNNAFEPIAYKEIDLNKISQEKKDKYLEMYGNISRVSNIEFFENIALTYCDELSVATNCNLLRDIICGKSLYFIIFDALRTKKYEKNFKTLLELRKYLNSLPEKYKVNLDLARLDEIIYKIDKTVFDIEIAFEDNMLFERYQSTELSKLLTQDDAVSDDITNVDTKVVEVPKKVIAKKKSKKDKEKQKEEKKGISKVFEEGTIIKQAGSSLGSPKLLVLTYTEDYCILINYSLYKVGTISVSIESDLTNYFKLEVLSKKELKDALLKCKYSSETFLLNQSCQKEEVKRIKKVFRKLK